MPLWFLVLLFLDKVLWEVLWGFVFFFNLEKKSKVLWNVRKSVVMNTTRQKHRGLFGWWGSAVELVWWRWPGASRRGAWEAEWQGSNVPCLVKACWYFLWQPGAALRSERVSGMLEAGVWNIIKHKYSVQFKHSRAHVTATKWQTVWKGTLRKRELLLDSGIKNIHKLIKRIASRNKKKKPLRIQGRYPSSV